MRLYLINPCNSLITLANVKESRWNRYRVWKPLGLLVLAGVTPPEWEITVVDENVGVPDYATMPRPDLVGITAFTSQALRAYEVAEYFRNLGVPVVMGGIHASMRQDEASQRVDSVVTGEAEQVWPQVLADVQHGSLKRVYAGGSADMADVPPARHDLLTSGYAIGSIQTTRGCPLNCSFCSVTAFNGSGYRHRPIDEVVREFRLIREKLILVVDDNLIGTRGEHIARAKDLFRAMIRAKLRKRWIGQVTINMSDDDELLTLAHQAGCRGVFIGFESPSIEGLVEVGKKYNYLNGRDFKTSVRRIQRHGIGVVGSFIMGLDTDQPGIGKQIAEAGIRYGVDLLNVPFLTPLPGTRLWGKLEEEGRIAAGNFPEDWKYYTFSFPVARYRHLSWSGMVQERDSCYSTFYSLSRILRRTWNSFWRGSNLMLTLVSNLSYRKNLHLHHKKFREFEQSRDESQTKMRGPLPHVVPEGPGRLSRTRRSRSRPTVVPQVPPSGTRQ